MPGLTINHCPIDYAFLSGVRMFNQEVSICGMGDFGTKLRESVN